MASELILNRERLIKGKYPDFVLCFGGTRKDEEMFNRLGKMLRDRKDNEVIENSIEKFINSILEGALVYMYSWKETIECEILCG